jgi:hypothetical protein
MTTASPAGVWLYQLYRVFSSEAGGLSRAYGHASIKRQTYYCCRLLRSMLAHIFNTGCDLPGMRPALPLLRLCRGRLENGERADVLAAVRGTRTRAAWRGDIGRRQTNCLYLVSFNDENKSGLLSYAFTTVRCVFRRRDALSAMGGRVAAVR